MRVSVWFDHLCATCYHVTRCIYKCPSERITVLVWRVHVWTYATHIKDQYEMDEKEVRGSVCVSVPWQRCGIHHILSAVPEISPQSLRGTCECWDRPLLPPVSTLMPDTDTDRLHHIMQFNTPLIHFSVNVTSGIQTHQNIHQIANPIKTWWVYSKKIMSEQIIWM